MLRYRSKVQAYKRQQGWRPEGEKQASFVGDEPFARPLSIKWDLLFLVPVALTAALGITGYNSMPDMLPLHVDFGGDITGMQPKSPGLVAFPVIAVAFVSACLTVYHWSIVRSKRPSDPAMPAASAWAYARFARAHTMLIVVAGLLAGFIGPLMELMFIGILSIWEAAGLCLAVVLPIVIGAVAVSVVYGQNGSRLLAHVEGSERMARDDDRYWKAGIFYVNRDDASLFLPERFGIGWTLNWARPAAWALTIVLVLAIAAFVVMALLV